MRFLLPFLLIALPALAQQAITADDFLRQAIEDTVADVEAGRLAQTTEAVPPQVQQLGRQIGGESTQFNQRLSRMAEQRNLHLGNQVSAQDRRAIEQLSRLKGAAFTREYLRYAIANLEHNQALYQAATRAEDPAVAQFARDSLPQLQNELMVARAVYDSQVAALPR